MQCTAYRLNSMKSEMEQEIEKLNNSERDLPVAQHESINRL